MSPPKNTTEGIIHHDHFTPELPLSPVAHGCLLCLKHGRLLPWPFGLLAHLRPVPDVRPLPDREEPLFTTLKLKKNGLWSLDGWNGSPDDTDRQVVSTVHIVPTDRETSYTTAEIWHWRACNRRQLRKEKKAGEVHRHGGRCQRIKSVKHVTWHIRSK